MSSLSYSFVAGDRGSWKVLSVAPVIGETLEPVPFLEIRNGFVMKVPVDFRWLLRGVSNREPHPECPEEEIAFHSGRNSMAALIPAKKSDEWWALPAEQRMAISQENSERIQAKLKGLPVVVKTLHHCRDLGEPFDFLTWFEYAAADAKAFEEFVRALREMKEWKYVEREVDVRLCRSI